MNTKSAKNVKEFCDVRARDEQGRPTIIFVPGHEGREYFVFIHRNGALRVRCNEPGPWGNQGCKGSLKHFCYHMLAALEFAAADQGLTISWCKSKQDAERLARIDGKVFHAKHANHEDVEVWGVVRDSKPKPEVVKSKFDLMTWANELENVSWYDADLARALADNGLATPAEVDALGQLLTKYPQKRPELARLFPEAVLEFGRNLLRGEDVREL